MTELQALLLSTQLQHRCWVEVRRAWCPEKLFTMLVTERSRCTQHSTNKAFERYFQRKASHSLKVSKAVTGLQQVYNIKDGVEKGKILKLKD